MAIKTFILGSSAIALRSAVTDSRIDPLVVPTRKDCWIVRPILPVDVQPNVLSREIRQSRAHGREGRHYKSVGTLESAQGSESGEVTSIS